MTAALAEALTEEWPDGTFGGPRPTVRTPDPNAAAHRAELLAALKQPAADTQ